MDRVESERNDVALVVGAGGPTGGPFIWAALEALEQRTGWSPSSAGVIVGTSAGAFVAASFTEDSQANPAAQIRVGGLSNVASLGQSSLARASVPFRRIAGRLVAAVAPKSRPLAEYHVPIGPFHRGASAVTVRSRSGVRTEHQLDAGGDVEAVVRASAAIPGLNRPVDIAGEWHIDGAVYSANNVDLVDPLVHPTLIVVSPMIPASGGSIASRFHRAQLLSELAPWRTDGRAAVVIMPSEQAHAERRDRTSFEAEGRAATERL